MNKKKQKQQRFVEGVIDCFMTLVGSGAEVQVGADGFLQLLGDNSEIISTLDIKSLNSFAADNAEAAAGFWFSLI